MSQRISVKTGNFELSALTAGSPDHSALVLLHGWHLSKAIWEPIIDRLGDRFFVLAFDLPGIGGSHGGETPVLTTQIAALVLDAAEAVGARDITFAGVDIGGMIAFSAARDHSSRIARSVIMNTVIPGIDPWAETLANTHIWHFAFHQVPNLPETLVAGNQRAYFDFFLDTLAGDKAKISDRMRDELAAAYSDASALKTGFDWYRAMPENAKHNQRAKRIDTPILYLRGDADHRDIAPYLDGLRTAGATHVTAKIIADSGEIVSLEQPDALIAALEGFIGETAG